METSTLAEAVLSVLLGQGKIDESNPQILRDYAEKAERRFGINTVGFYTDLYSIDGEGDVVGSYDLLDARVYAIVDFLD